MGVDIPTVVMAVVQLGLSVALSLFFVWRDHVRETNTQQQIKEMETFQRTTLMELVTETNKHIATGTHVLERVTKCMERMESKDKSNSNL